MSDIKNSANWSFETKQLHIGQEQADPTPVRSRSTLPPPMFSIMPSMPPTVSACGTPAISTAD